MPQQHEIYASLQPRLAALADEVSALARPRPLVAPPSGLVRLAQKLLREVRAFVPDLPRGALTLSVSKGRTGDAQQALSFSELAAHLGQARAALEAYGKAQRFDQKTARPSKDMEQLRARLAARIDAIREAEIRLGLRN